jgi:hypothetical protein
MLKINIKPSYKDGVSTHFSDEKSRVKGHTVNSQKILDSGLREAD